MNNNTIIGIAFLCLGFGILIGSIISHVELPRYENLTITTKKECANDLCKITSWAELDGDKSISSMESITYCRGKIYE